MRHKDKVRRAMEELRLATEPDCQNWSQSSKEAWTVKEIAKKAALTTDQTRDALNQMWGWFWVEHRKIKVFGHNRHHHQTYKETGEELEWLVGDYQNNHTEHNCDDNAVPYVSDGPLGQSKKSDKIHIVHVTKGDPTLKGRGFRSYAAVAKALKIGERVVVSVHARGWLNDEPMLEGYGEVERTTEDGYTCPRRLMHEW